MYTVGCFYTKCMCNSRVKKKCCLLSETQSELHDPYVKLSTNPVPIVVHPGIWACFVAYLTALSKL